MKKKILLFTISILLIPFGLMAQNTIPALHGSIHRMHQEGVHFGPAFE